jgi:hypothetical protein
MISWDRSVITAAPLRSKLLGPSFNGRGGILATRPRIQAKPHFPAPSVRHPTLGVALFGGLFCICEWPISASAVGLVLACFDPRWPKLKSLVA